MHFSLRVSTNIALMCGWLAIGVALFLLSSGAAVLLIVPAALIGGIAGALQGAAFRDGAPFLVARTALEVRAALRRNKWGAVYLLLFWVSQLSFFAIATWIALGAPANAFRLTWFGGSLLSLYSGFAIAREAAALPSLIKLARR